MFPIFWRFLLKKYLSIFFLSIISFITILLVTRLEEISKFISISPSIKNIFIYILCQIPFILPIAILISCLLSSIMLFQGLSRSNELTAIRACGISLKMVLLPIFFVSIFFFAINFYISSELVPQSKTVARQILYEQTSSNPILIMQTKDSNFVSLEKTNNEKLVKNVFFITKNKTYERLNLFFAKELEIKKSLLTGKNISIISHIESQSPEIFDTLIIENQEKMSTNASILGRYMKPLRVKLAPNYLTLPLLLIKLNLPEENNKIVNQIKIEILKRISFATAVFAFTFMGIAFGIDLSKRKIKTNIFYPVLLSTMILIGFSFGKSCKNNLFLAFAIYFLPQIFALIISFIKIGKISKGKI